MGQLMTRIQTERGISTQTASVLDTKDAYVIEIAVDHDTHAITVSHNAHTISLNAASLKEENQTEHWEKHFYFDDVVPALMEAVYDRKGLMLILPKRYPGKKDILH